MYKKKYGINDEEKAEILPLKKAEGDIIGFDPKYPFGNPSIIPKFWEEVRDEYNAGKNGLSASQAQRKIRLFYLQQSISKNDDILVHLLRVIPDKFKSVVNGDIKYTNLVFEINEFVILILEEDSKKERRERKYDKLLKIDSSRRTILHLAAEQDLDMVVETIILFYPSLVNVSTNIAGFNDNPLCIALSKFYDRTASLLVKSMDSYSVRCLFETNDSVEARFHFKDYIDPKESISMKLTVLAILEKLMNPYWPFQPINQADKEIEWYDMPKAPLSHHFYFQLLDGDDKGNAPENNNKRFNYRSKSCLHLIAHSSSCREAIQHPVVRLLVKRKWNDYGQNIMRINAALYLFFLVLFSFALFLQPSTQRMHIFRMFCEIGTILFTFFYILLELDEGDKRWSIYFSDYTNYIDILGLGTILLIIPFRFAKLFHIEWIISAVAYFINCLRLFQYFIVIKELHIYYRTFHIIIVEDIRKFAALFLVIILAFTGSVTMALKSTAELHIVGGYWGIFFKEIRGLAESQSFSDDYSNINVIVVIFLMCNMFCTMVVLLNILIGQISNRYNEVQSMAKVQYDIDKTKFITKIDNSRLCGKLRIRYYQNGGYTTSSSEEDEVIADWVAMKENEFLKEDNKKKFESMRGNLKFKGERDQ
ncbi:uncharacterized protein LOC101236412 isoform X3 [Hydra vulgaris]|uniref:Uncharacterized protein LOC101236412 isoform X3 n=1 Tax=Hydra vulgaris TaxID=6087 RepID=A0ABM4BFL7_HYDVU